MKTTANPTRSIPAAFMLLCIMTLLLAGCDKKPALPLYPGNLDPGAVLRIMERRALALGSMDCGLSLEFTADDSKASLEGVLAWQTESDFRLQVAYPEELPVLELAIKGRSAHFYAPGAMSSYLCDTDSLLAPPTGFSALAEAIRYLPGSLSGFTPYGARFREGAAEQFVFSRRAGAIECKAFVNRTTLTIAALLYTTADGPLFKIEFADFLPTGEGVWPRAFYIAANDFEVLGTVKSFEQGSSHSISDFIIQELPGTARATSLRELLEAIGGQTN